MYRHRLSGNGWSRSYDEKQQRWNWRVGFHEKLHGLFRYFCRRWCGGYGSFLATDVVIFLSV